MSKYNFAEASNLYIKACEYNLKGADLLLDVQKVIENCNGIGAEWMPEIMRKLADILNPVMEIPACIHDMRYTIGGDEDDKEDADIEFMQNCLKVCDKRYSWYNPMRYLMRNRISRYYQYLSDFGEKAWTTK